MFSTTCQYAIRAVLYLAQNTDEKKKIGVDDLSKALGIPRHFLAKIMQQLSKKRLICSSKGRNGGFFLSKKNQSANLLEVIYSIDGPSRFTECILGLPNCSDDKPCPYHDVAVSFRKDFLFKLTSETIEESAKRIVENNYKLKQ